MRINAVPQPRAELHRALPRGRNRLPVALVRRDQRERLLRSMIDAAAERCYAAVTVGEVVARARVSRSSFYAQFESKEDCFVAASTEGRARLVAQVRQAVRRLPAGSSDELRLRVALRAYLVSHRDDPALATVVYVEWLGVRSRDLERLVAGHDSF